MRLALAALALTLAACSGPAATTAPEPVGEPIGFAVPPSGALSAEQLARLDADLDRLLAAPLAPDAAAARQTVLDWISASPDVTVRLCADLAGPLAETDSETEGGPGYLLLFVAASADAILEAPGIEEDPSAVAAAAAEQLVETYAIARSGGSPAVRALDDLARRQREGTLDAHVRRLTDGC